jgi:uncharacterized protein (DUF302 family)/uncharacterized membrane protein YidH (DUF202 family)
MIWMSDRTNSGASDYLAAERTFLAWIRTGLALMGFGFVVARFGLFLQVFLSQTKLGNEVNLASQPYGLSFWFGTALIVAGVLVNVVSTWNHIRLIHALSRGEFSTRPSRLAIAVSLLLAVLGLAMAAYLSSVREPSKQEKTTMNPTFQSGGGIITVDSHHSVDQTVERLEALLQAKGIKLFTVVDHSGEAQKVGMQMRPTKLLILGNPKAGTPLMLASPTIAIDLPLKLLVWEEAGGRTRISYNDPAYLQERHGLPQELVQNIAAAGILAAEGAKS